MAEPLKSAAELVAEQRGEDPTESSSSNEDPKARREYTFQFEQRESGTGKMRRGPFTNHILTIRMKRQIGSLIGQLSGGAPWLSLTPYDQELFMKIAHLSVSLDRKKRPKWAADLEDLVDDAILDALYEEVAAHEATFHGRSQDQEESKSDGGADGSDGGSDDLASGQAPAP